MSYAENLQILHEEATRMGATSDEVAYLASAMKVESGGDSHAKSGSNNSSRSKNGWAKAISICDLRFRIY